MWPNDSLHHVFLLRAFEEIGSAYFRELWSGKEREISDLPAIPSLANRGGNAQRVAAYLLKEHRPDLPPPFQIKGRSEAFLTANQWVAADQLFAAHRLYHDAARSSFEKVAEFMRKMLSMGELVATARPYEGGEQSAPLETTIWDAERIQWRFDSGLINFATPYTRPIGTSRGFHWLFVTRASVSAVVERVATWHQATPSSTDLESGLAAIDMQEPQSGEQSFDRRAVEAWALESMATAISSGKRVGVREFVKKVTDEFKDAQGNEIRGVATLARSVWDEKRPEPWSKRGRHSSRAKPESN